ncbi:MAG: nitroreductase family protein [bacterium]|nr:nitroreductase family protein [bacterium]
MMTHGQDHYECLYSICRERRSIRDFLPEPVPKEIIGKILNIAHTSPYASNKKNWEVLVITDKTQIEKMADTVRQAAHRLSETMRDDLKEGFLLYARHFTGFRTAPLLLIPVFRVGKSFSYMVGDNWIEAPQWERDNYVKSISCVCMLLLLAAESLGLGSCFMTGPLIAEEEIGKLIKIKKGRQIGAIIPVGYYNKEIADEG